MRRSRSLAPIELALGSVRNFFSILFCLSRFGIRFIKRRLSVILWILKEDQYSVDFLRFLFFVILLFDCYCYYLYYIIFSGGALTFKKFISVDSTQVLRSWRAEWNCYFDPRYHGSFIFSSFAFNCFESQRLATTHHWNYNHELCCIFDTIVFCGSPSSVCCKGKGCAMWWFWNCGRIKPFIIFLLMCKRRSDYTDEDIMHLSSAITPFIH